MPHYKCVACRTRLFNAGGPSELVGDLCPQCGALLEPVGRLSEILGFRSIQRLDGAEPAASAGQLPLAERVDGLIDHREAGDSAASGSGFVAAAVAVAISQPR
ncbi:MAG TPA: hypothetical protein VKG61_19065 [Streptosporangiaceae bacterium]|nr:hypothetical protein [Streptosporangiaceae bacterium]